MEEREVHPARPGVGFRKIYRTAAGGICNGNIAYPARTIGTPRNADRTIGVLGGFGVPFLQGFKKNSTVFLNGYRHISEYIAFCNKYKR